MISAAWLFLKRVPPWVYLLIALVIGAHLYGNHRENVGEKTVQAKWDKETLGRTNAEKAAVLARIADNQKKFRQQEITNQNIDKRHKDEMAKVRSDIANAPRLRIGSALCGGSSSGTKAEGASGSAEANTGAGLVRSDVDRDIAALKLTVEEAFATGRACQDFMIKNGLADGPAR